MSALENKTSAFDAVQNLIKTEIGDEKAPAETKTKGKKTTEIGDAAKVGPKKGKVETATKEPKIAQKKAKPEVETTKAPKDAVKKAKPEIEKVTKAAPKKKTDKATGEPKDAAPKKKSATVTAKKTEKATGETKVAAPKKEAETETDKMETVTNTGEKEATTNHKAIAPLTRTFSRSLFNRTYNSTTAAPEFAHEILGSLHEIILAYCAEKVQLLPCRFPRFRNAHPKFHFYTLSSRDENFSDKTIGHNERRRNEIFQGVTRRGFRQQTRIVERSTECLYETLDKWKASAR